MSPYPSQQKSNHRNPSGHVSRFQRVVGESNGLLAYRFFISVLGNFECGAGSGYLGVLDISRVNCTASDIRDFVKLARMARQGPFAVDVQCLNLALNIFLESLDLGGLFHHLQAQYKPFMRSRGGYLGIEGHDILHEVVQLGHLAFDDKAGMIVRHG